MRKVDYTSTSTIRFSAEFFDGDGIAVRSRQQHHSAVLVNAHGGAHQRGQGVVDLDPQFHVGE